MQTQNTVPDRGGDFDDGTFAGPFAIDATGGPSLSSSIFGFRGAR